jgi:hypothetical protein
MQDIMNSMRRFGVGEATDCPVFDGLYEFQASCAGASIDAAALLNHGQVGREGIHDSVVYFISAIQQKSIYKLKQKYGYICMRNAFRPIFA